LDGQPVQAAADGGDLVEHGLGQEQFLAPRARFLDVDGGIDARLGQAAIKHDFHVAGALELLENDFVHARAGIDQRGGDDGQRTGLLGLAGGGENLARDFQRAGADAAAHGVALGTDVEGTAQACDRVHENEHVAAAFDQALGALDHQLRQAHMAGVFLVVGRRPKFAATGEELTEIGDLLGPLVDQDDHEEGVGRVGQHRVGDGLHQHRLARAR
jgi:hypothetical protein